MVDNIDRLDYQWNKKTQKLDLLWTYEKEGNYFYKARSLDIRKILGEIDD